MSNHQVFVELLVNILFVSLLKVLNQFLKHFTESLELNLVNCSQDFNGNGFVNREHLGDSRGIIARQASSSSLEVTLLEMGLGELHQVSIKELTSLLFS